MLKETRKSLRLYFGIVSAFSLLSGVAAVSQSRDSFLVIALSAANIGFGVLFGYIVVKFAELLPQRPAFIKKALTANFALSILVFFLSLSGGIQPGAIFNLAIAALVYVYLVKSVARLSAERISQNA